MAFGTLKADTLTHSTAGSLDTNFVVDGSAKAAYAFNIDSEFMTIANNTLSSESLNASSGTDRGTGTLTVALTSAMATRQFIFLAGCKATNNTHCLDGSSTASSILSETNDADSNSASDQCPYAAIFGDLA